MTSKARSNPKTAPALVVSLPASAANTQKLKTSSRAALTPINTKPTVLPLPIMGTCFLSVRFFSEVSRSPPRRRRLLLLPRPRRSSLPRPRCCWDGWSTCCWCC